MGWAQVAEFHLLFLLITFRPPEGARSSVEQSLPQEHCLDHAAKPALLLQTPLILRRRSLRTRLRVYWLPLCVMHADVVWCVSVQHVVDDCTHCCLITRSKSSGQISNIPTRIGDRYFEHLSMVKCSKEKEQTHIMFMMKSGSGSNSEYYVYVSVHRWSILIIAQRDAT